MRYEPAVLCVLAAAASLWTSAAHAQPQAYPVKPIRVIVPSAAGGGGDIVARAIGLKLAESWGQQVIVDNRSGIVGPELAAQALPDGYTIMLTTSALVVRESVYTKLPFNTLRDFAPVTQVVTQANVLVVHPALPVRTVQELVALAKAKPGQLNYGSGGNGTSNHLAAELFRLLAGINVVHVPYKGVPQAMTDLMAGRLQFSIGSSVSTLPHVKDGRLRLLAVATPRRSPALPDVPTIAESGVPGCDFTGWMGVLAPQKTARDIVHKLSREIARIVRLPDVQQRFALDAAEAVGSTPEEFTAYLKTELARWTKVAREANIQTD